MRKHIGLALLALSIGGPCWLSAEPSYGLPGHAVNEVKTWMQGHPTLRADSREGLRVHRADVPSRRFTFQASVFPVGGFQGNNLIAGERQNLGVVRREEFILVDYDAPVTVDRLEESLRTLYGPDIYADYRRSQSVYNYASGVHSRQGEVRLGSTYGYWVEITPDVNGVVTTGKLNVTLAEDIDRLQSYLELQEPAR